MSTHAVTLLFHDVVPEGRWESSGFQGAGADVYKLDCARFHGHLQAIAQSLRSKPITAIELLAGARPPADSPVLLTFDDGGVSASLHIAGMLDEFGWKAHFLVTAGRIGTPGFLDAAQIRDLHRRGHVIGSHSYSHPLRMALCSTAALNDEWRRSTLVLSEILGEPIRVASVPGGYYSRQVAVAADTAGIELLFNSEPVTHLRTVAGCLVVGRFTAQRSTPPAWSAAIVAGGGQARIRQYLFWNAKKIAKILLGGLWLRARVTLLSRRSADPSRSGADPRP